MSAKFFIVANRRGEITYKPAEQCIATNLDAYLSFDTPCYEHVLAQADTEEQAQRFVELLRNRRAA